MKFSLTKMVIAIILILAVLLLYPSFLDLRKSKREIAKLDKTISELEALNEHLRFEIQALQEDKLYIEKTARENLGLIKPGEVIYKIVPPEEQEDK